MAKPLRLDRYLAHLQYGTRSEVKQLIRAKRVRVDQQVTQDPGAKVTATTAVSVDGQPVGGTLAVNYLMNKPAGVITATRDAQARTVLDLIAPQDRRPRLAPVGRLDKDTTGLLLLTTDGALAHALLAPGHHVPKTYLVTAAAPVTPAMQRQLAAGVALKDFTTAPAQVELRSATQLLLTIHEGKYHQVKRMLLAVGNEVVALQRVQMGALRLPADLPAGQYRPLTAAELAALRQ